MIVSVHVNVLNTTTTIQFIKLMLILPTTAQVIIIYINRKSTSTDTYIDKW